MTQAALDFDAPAVDKTANPHGIPVDETRNVHKAMPKCENMNCSNDALPGRQMCRACAERFGPYLQGKILGWKR